MSLEASRGNGKHTICNSNRRLVSPNYCTSKKCYVHFSTTWRLMLDLHLKQISFCDFYQACIVGMSAWTTLWNLSFLKALFKYVLFFWMKKLLTIWINNFCQSQATTTMTFLHKYVCFLIISWKFYCQGLLELSNWNVRSYFALMKTKLYCYNSFDGLQLKCHEFSRRSSL